MRADYEQRMQSLTVDMLRMREEMQQRTVYMQREMQRYQATAMATAAAMAAAKKEVGERRKEIDATRSKMDGLMERLYSGHEHNVTLQANISTAQDHAGESPAGSEGLVEAHLAVAPRRGCCSCGSRVV